MMKYGFPIALTIVLAVTLGWGIYQYKEKTITITDALRTIPNATGTVRLCEKALFLLFVILNGVKDLHF